MGSLWGRAKLDGSAMDDDHYSLALEVSPLGRNRSLRLSFASDCAKKVSSLLTFGPF